MSAAVTWRTDDPWPVCGAGLVSTDDSAGSQVAQNCPLCGWSTTSQASPHSIKED